MINFIGGVIIGIVIATIGFSGVAHRLDQGVEFVKRAASEVK